MLIGEGFAETCKRVKWKALGATLRTRTCDEGREHGVRRLARRLSIIRTCNTMGINPRAYLRDTLAKILASEKSLQALLPETYAALCAERAPPVAA